MRGTTFATFASFCILLGVILFGFSRPKDAIATAPQPPAQRTGAPGENTCGSCHTGTLLANGSISISISASEYIPGDTYPVVITIADPLQLRWGFEITALKNSNNSMAGSFQSTTQLTGIQSAGGKTYAGHNNNGAVLPLNPQDGTHWGTLNGPVSWAVNWIAPAQGSGTVTFYASGVAANGDGLQGLLDYSYKTQRQLTEASPTPVSSTTWGKIKKRYQ
jgi:hypothetical protein